MEDTQNPTPAAQTEAAANAPDSAVPAAADPQAPASAELVQASGTAPQTPAPAASTGTPDAKPDDPASQEQETVQKPSVDEQLDRMVTATCELLTRHRIKGERGEVGLYNEDTLASACERIRRGAVHADTGYGIIIDRQYFETANLL